MDFLGGLTISGGVSIVPPGAPPVASYTLYSWGFNSFFDPQLGLGDNVYRSSPTQVGASNAWISNSGTIGIKTNGTLWAWGGNQDGQLGLNSSQPGGEAPGIDSPTQVGSGTNWKTVFSILESNPKTAAIKNDGTLWIWGNGFGGGLGLGDVVSKSSPTQLGAGTNWASLSFSRYHTLALKTDNTLWSWGYNGWGELGLLDRVYRSSPTQIGTGTDWSLISSGNYTSFAIKTNGTLWGWGRNVNGELGINDRISRSSPTQIGSATDWDKVSVSSYNNAVLAVKTDGTLWAWGRNDVSGQLGLNNTIQRSSPTQVGSDTNWDNIYTGGAQSFAIKTTGTLWAWGTNSNGALGLNDTINRSSPTQVGSATTWVSNSTSDHSSNTRYSGFGFRS